VLLVALFVTLAKALIPLIARGDLGSRTRDLLLALISILATLTILELVFTFVPRSYAVGYTYAAQNWFQYYWRVNELGYRERSPSTIDARKKVVLSIGDSFTAGHGIRRPRDRFSDILGRQLGAGYEVVNLGRNGADTRMEFETLRKAPWRPSTVILQYYCNDIEGVARESGLSFPGFTPYHNRLIMVLSLSSYLVNYVYWLFPHSDEEPYTEFLFGAYRNRRVFDAHLADLQRFVRYADENHVHLIVVVFPFYLEEPSRSSFITQAVGRLFQENGVAVVDVAQLIDSLPPRERIVNRNDGHASTKVHRLVADALYRRVIEFNAGGLP